MIRLPVASAALLLLVTASAQAITIPEIGLVARCQKSIAAAGAQFAQKVIRATLKCTNAVVECQVQCEAGVFGPSCDNAGPPCCDADDPNSNAAFGVCMTSADALCAVQNDHMAVYETQKQIKIRTACSPLTVDQLCGANGEGLNFATLNAGCQALDPNYTCDLEHLLGCVGGPLQRQLTDQIGALLDPRAPDAVAAANLEGILPGIPVARKVVGTVAPGKADVWTITGQAGDQVVVRVRLRNDGTGTSALRPRLALLAGDGITPVANTKTVAGTCNLTSTCGATCPTLHRTLPFDGTFSIAVVADTTGGCGGGAYRLVVRSPPGATPLHVGDDVDPTP
jgi:hypothetical protein